MPAHNTVNYVVDTNPFNLAGPPTWWLSRLWDFDDSLVVLPSRQGFFYRLSQRRKPNPSTDIVNSSMFNESDAKMLARYGLVPVTTIMATANWSNPYLFEELRRRAPWRLGGAKTVIEDIEGRETQDEIDKRVVLDDQLQRVSKDAWKYYLKKIGVRETYDLGAKR